MPPVLKVVVVIALLAGAAFVVTRKDQTGDVDFSTVTVKRGDQVDVWGEGSEYYTWLTENGLADTAATKGIYQSRQLTSS